jgi:hypothetical protein
MCYTSRQLLFVHSFMPRLGEGSWKNTLAAAALATGVGCVNESPNGREAQRDVPTVRDNRTTVSPEEGRRLEHFMMSVRENWGDLNPEEAERGLNALMDEIDRTEEERNPDYRNRDELLLTDKLENLQYSLEDLGRDESLDLESTREIQEDIRAIANLPFEDRNTVIDALYNLSLRKRIEPELAVTLMEHFEKAWASAERLDPLAARRAR